MGRQEALLDAREQDVLELRHVLQKRAASRTRHTKLRRFKRETHKTATVEGRDTRDRDGPRARHTKTQRFRGATDPVGARNPKREAHNLLVADGDGVARRVEQLLHNLF